ncbi:MAG TPA: DciA family protein [bacterium]|nr:DciA family protein [bacterium]
MWRQELFYQKRNIIERINSALGEKIVREIVFR